MSDRSAIRLFEARVDDLYERVRRLEELLDQITERDRQARPAEPSRATHLSAAEAAKFLGVSESLLARWRCDLPGGPPYIKLGRRVLYPFADLAAHAAARRRAPLV